MNITQLTRQIRNRSEKFEKVVAACKELLRASPEANEARNYVNGRVSSFSQNKYDFGYFPAMSELDLLISKVGEDTLKDLNLIYDWRIPDRTYTLTVNKGLLNDHNLIIPYKDEYGNIIALIGRSLLPDDKLTELNIRKYKYSFFTKSLHLFGLNQAKKAIRKNDSVILVEGQIDCITCHSYGFHNVVALGGSSLGRYQFYLLNKYTNNIYLLLDNDAAGLKAKEKIVQRYSQFANLKQISLPTRYKDIDEYLHKSINYSALDVLI